MVSPNETWRLLIHHQVKCGWELSQRKSSETELERSISAQSAAVDLPSFYVPGLQDPLVCCRGFLLSWLSFADVFDLKPFLWNRLVFQDNRSASLLLCLLLPELLQPTQGGFWLIYSGILSLFILTSWSLSNPVFLPLLLLRSRDAQFWLNIHRCVFLISPWDHHIIPPVFMSGRPKSYYTC